MKYLNVKFLLFIFMLSGSAVTTIAQIDKTDEVKKQLTTENKDTIAWVHGGVFNVGINQGLLHNWQAGGELASLTLNGIFSGYLTRLHNRSVWSNNLDLTYGVFYAYSNRFIPRKTDDRIDFTSKYGYKLDTGKDFYITGLFNFRSQFTPGYDYSLPSWDTMPTSKFFAPAYFTVGAGLEYRKGTNVSLFLSPLTARMIVADRLYTSRQPEGAFGIPYGKTFTFQLGAYFSGRYTWNINERTLFKTRLDLYSNYLAKDQRDTLGVVVKRNSPANIVVLWDNFFSWKAAKFLSITVGATCIYDNDVPYKDSFVDETGAVVKKNEPAAGLGWLQLKQIFTVGFEYRF